MDKSILSELKLELQEAGVPEDTIDGLMTRITLNENIEKHGRSLRRETVADLQEKLLEETDWRKKASIAARIISLNIESGY